VAKHRLWEAQRGEKDFETLDTAELSGPEDENLAEAA